MNLTAEENLSYQKNFVNKIPRMVPGIYNIKHFFGTEPSVPRIARKFYSDVKKGIYPNIKLVGTTSGEGYLVL